MSTPKVTKLFRLDLDMHHWIEAQAEHRRVSQAQVVRDLILEAMRAEQDSSEASEKGDSK